MTNFTRCILFFSMATFRECWNKVINNTLFPPYTVSYEAKLTKISALVGEPVTIPIQIKSRFLAHDKPGNQNLTIHCVSSGVDKHVELNNGSVQITYVPTVPGVQEVDIQVRHSIFDAQGSTHDLKVPIQAASVAFTGSGTADDFGNLYLQIYPVTNGHTELLKKRSFILTAGSVKEKVNILYQKREYTNRDTLTYAALADTLSISRFEMHQQIIAAFKSKQAPELILTLHDTIDSSSSCVIKIDLRHIAAKKISCELDSILKRSQQLHIELQQCTQLLTQPAVFKDLNGFDLFASQVHELSTRNTKLTEQVQLILAKSKLGHQIILDNIVSQEEIFKQAADQHQVLINSLMKFLQMTEKLKNNIDLKEKLPLYFNIQQACFVSKDLLRYYLLFKNAELTVESKASQECRHSYGNRLMKTEANNPDALILKSSAVRQDLSPIIDDVYEGKYFSDMVSAPPLIIACQRQQLDMVAMLLAHPNIDINALCDGYPYTARFEGSEYARLTALHMACGGRGYTQTKFDIIKLLVQHKGINLNMLDSEQCTALDRLYKEECRYNKEQNSSDEKIVMQQIKQFLIENGAKYQKYELV